jgi:6-phosphogluconolactonase
MLLRFALILFLLLGRQAGAEIIPFYIGTYTSPEASKGIYAGSLDTDTGKLGALKLAAEVKDPNFLAISPDRRFLFAVRDSSVESFLIEPDAKLKPLNEKPTGGAGPCHVSVDQKGRYVFVANYDGGNIACFAVGVDGLIGERTALEQFTGTGPDPRRQTKPFAHSVYADPTDKFVYACDLGTDSVWIFHFSGALGTLRPADPEKSKTPPGSGPRHLAFRPDGKFIYVVGEMGLGVTAFSRNAESGALTAVQTALIPAPGGPALPSTGAEICCHPSGKWLYASVRGFDLIAQFAIAENGTLTFVEETSSIAKFPRSFAIDPTGHWLIAAGQKDNRIAVLKIDPITGHLSATDQTADVGSPVCVLFVPKK